MTSVAAAVPTGAERIFMDVQSMASCQNCTGRGDKRSFVGEEQSFCSGGKARLLFGDPRADALPPPDVQPCRRTPALPTFTCPRRARVPRHNSSHLFPASRPSQRALSVAASPPDTQASLHKY